ncbi:Protein soga3, partial [Dermatophagoides pteronyssinus]
SSNISTKSGCTGFIAHSINPTRCRKCYKDISEHRQQQQQQPSNDSTNLQPLSSENQRFKRPQRSSSLKLDSSSDHSQSVSFTLKPKCVKFSDTKNVDDDDGGGNENKNQEIDDNDPIDVAFTVCVQKSPKTSTSSENFQKNEQDYQSRIQELSQQLTKSKEKIDLLESKNKEFENMCKTFGKMSATESGRGTSIRQNFDEMAKLKQSVTDMQNEIKTLKNEKKTLEDKIKRTSSDTVNELRSKLIQSEKLIAQLTQENEDIKKDVKELEVEFQELHDNFREDQSSEFRVIKHELEAMSKNCRVLQFKLKKAERTVEQLENEKLDMQKQLHDLYETTQMDVDKRKMKELENELSIAKEVSLKLHAEIEQLKEERLINMEQLQQQQQNSNTNNNKLTSTTNDSSRKPFGKLSPSPSFDQNTKDYEQVVRDLYDTMEREKDLQEQLKFSEEETRTMRKKLSTMEQENEILMLQIRKMTSKNNQAKDEDESESDELNPEEMKLHLELYEQEMIVLRRKTDELEQENENFQQEIKYLQDKLVSQPITKVEIPEIPAGSPPNVIYDHKIKILETEARELRKKLVDKEKENESLRTEVELHRRRASKVINRSRSLDSEGQSLDMKKQLQLFEQEANILRQKLIALENDNEKLLNENKRLQLRISKKPPPGPVDQLQIENIELKDKIRELERKCDSLKTDLMNTKLNTETTETETDFIANLKKQLRQKENDLANQQSKLAQMDIEMAKINREYKKLKDSLNPRRRVNRVIRETATRLELKEIIKEMEEETEHLQTNIRGKDAVIENLAEEVSELKRSIQELGQQQKSNNIGANNINNKYGIENSDQHETNKADDLKKRLEEEQHRSKSLQEKLDKLVQTPTKKNDDKLQKECKDYLQKINDLKADVQRYKTNADDLNNKLSEFIQNNKQLNNDNGKLQQQLKQSDEKINELTKKLKTSEKFEKELNNKLDEMKKELERVQNLNSQLINNVDSNTKYKAATIDSGDNRSITLQKEYNEMKRKLDESRMTINELQKQLERQQNEFKEKENKIREEFNQKVEITSKNVRKEVHHELQSLREESTNYKNRSTELATKLEKAEKDLKELNEKLKSNNVQVRKEQNESMEKIQGLENQLKNEQRKRERLEKEVENVGRGREEELLRSQERIVQLEREIRRHQAKLDDVEYEYTNRINSSEKELNKIKQDYDDLTNKYDMLEKDYVDLKSRAVAEKETLVEAVGSLKKSYEEKLNEIKSLKETSMSQRKEWYKEKLTLQERIADLESKLNKANLIEEEHKRLKVLLSEKENLLNSYRKEERVHNEERERNRIKIDALQTRITELERVERNTRFMNITGRAQVDKELQDYRIRLEHSETSHKGELAALHAEYESRMRLLGEEVEHLQQQMVHLAQERDRYRESLEKSNKDQGTFKGTFRNEIEDLHSQLRIVRTDLEGALLENRNLKIQHGTEKSTWQIQLAEYKTKINQLEERILLETRGSTRNYARTKMELAWEKERQENLRLLQDTQKFIQELRDKLVGSESLHEKEREQARRQLLELKTNMDKEHVETQQKIAELQFDLLALKEVHARLKSQNERYKRERGMFEKAKMNFIDTEMIELRKIVDSIQKSPTTTSSSAKTFRSSTQQTTTKNQQQEEIVAAINQLKERLNSRYNEMMQEAREASQISVSSNLNGRYTGGSSSSLTSTTNLPPPGQIKRAPPRLKLVKKSLSLDQQLRGASQERIWDSDHSLNSTPNSSISNLRGRYAYGGGYESDSSGSGFFAPSNTMLRLRPGFSKDSSFAGGSDSDTSVLSSAEPKKTLKERFKIRKSSKSSDDEALKQKLALQGFEKSPIELAKQREKKEKSLRYKISKTLSKTFSRSASVLSETPETQSSKQHQSINRTKSPTRSKSPEVKKLHQESSSMVIPGIAQLKQKPTQSNLAIPPSKRSPPPKIKIYRTETNV